MKDQLKRILNLVRKTGDTMIVTDPNGDDVYVVMNLDQYESLLELPNDSYLETLENDEQIEDIWPELPISESNNSETKRETDIWETMQPAGENGDTWNVSNMSEMEIADMERQYKDYVTKAISDVVEPEKDKTTENTSQIPKQNEEEFGEEQFYLEPIE